MSLFGHCIVVLAYALLAAALGLSFGPSLAAPGFGGSMATAGLVFLAFALGHEFLLRRSSLHETVRLMRELRQANAQTAADLGATRRDLTALRRQLEGVQREGAEKMAGEMQMLKGLLQQLNDRMLRRRVSGPSTSAAVPLPIRREAPGELPADAAQQLDMVRMALEDNRVDLYLQPIVSLPQRKVRFYESFSRIRNVEGGVLAPEQYLALAEDNGLITTIDNLLLFRCVQLIRRTKGRRRDVGFFVNMSVRSLQDEEFFGQFYEFLQQNADLADNLFFEFSQGDIEKHGAAVAAAMERLADLGFRFSLDQVSSLDVDYNGLARASFRFVKIDARALTSREHQSVASIDVADLKLVLGRNGIDLIAEKIETEPMVVDLLEFDVDYGQGYLFGEPRRSREAA
ncbi:MAG TPA: EAL domain-containing protein [Candidatus Sulfotelmatobacter sp.]|nr:EAL domain-containing protein [Candidatus Sulfotelmatobacter sp.]